MQKNTLNINILEKSFGEKKLYQNVNIQFDVGLHLIKGENGVGKSTLFKIIYGLEDYHGTIKFCDTNISELELAHFRTNYCTYINQHYNQFFSLTAKENIDLLVDNHDEEKLNFLAEKLNFTQLLTSKTHVNKLSGGEKQKLSLLIGLLSETPILLIDEPENNLDIYAIKFLSEYLLETEQIVIISSHSLSEYTDTSQMNEYEIKEFGIFLKNRISQKKQVNVITKNYCRTLSKKQCSQLIKKNSTYIVVMTFLFTISIVVLSLLNSIFLNTLTYLLTTQDDNYKNTMVITAPLYNSLYTELGDESWLKTTPMYFDDDHLKLLQEIAGVKAVLPMDDHSTTITNYNTPEGYELSLNIEYENLNYEQYGYKELENNELHKSSIDFQEEYSPLQITSTVPYYLTKHRFDELVWGTLAQDQSNEIVIDQITAMHFAEQYNHQSLEQLIGQKVSYDIKCLETNCPETKEYIVSGIYNADVAFDSIEHVSTVYGGYDQNSDLVRRNNKWMGDENSTIDAYTNLVGQYESSGVEPPTMEQFVAQNNTYYPSLYISFTDESVDQKLVEQVSKYDKYIEIDSKYALETSHVSMYLQKKFIKITLEIAIALIVITFVIIMCLKFLFKNTLQIIQTLEYFGFDIFQQRKYLNYEYRVLMAVTVVVNAILIITLFLITKKLALFMMLALNLVVLLIIIVVVRKYLKKNLHKKFERNR